MIVFVLHVDIVEHANENCHVASLIVNYQSNDTKHHERNFGEIDIGCLSLPIGERYLSQGIVWFYTLRPKATFQVGLNMVFTNVDTTCGKFLSKNHNFVQNQTTLYDAHYWTFSGHAKTRPSIITRVIMCLVVSNQEQTCQQNRLA